jgi:hypothetical protein
MRIKHIVTIALATFALCLAGCSEEETKRSDAVERVTPEEPVLTSTVTPAAPEPTPAEPTTKAPEEESKVVDSPETPELPDPPTFEPDVETVDGVTLQRFVTTSIIEKREPVDPMSAFGPQHEKVYAFVEVSNESETDKSLYVHFVGPKGKVSGGIELEIPASVPRWRTWAYTRHFASPGLWRVEIRDADGKLLGALPFEVEAGL